MAKLSLNGCDHFYQEMGEGAETIIFTHGVFFDSDICLEQMKFFASKYRCIGFDWRSQGRSEDSAFGHDVDGLTQDCIALMDKLGIKKAHWVGVSIGGVVGIRLAARYPDRIQSLCLMGATADKEKLEKLEKYELLTEAFFKDKEIHADQLLALLFGQRFCANATEYEQAKTRLLANNPATMRRALTPIIRRTDIRHLLPKITCPTLIVVGEEDAANGPDRAATLHADIKSSRLAILSSVGHTPTLEAPDDVNSHLSTFYEKHKNTG